MYAGIAAQGIGGTFLSGGDDLEGMSSAYMMFEIDLHVAFAYSFSIGFGFNGYTMVEISPSFFCLNAWGLGAGVGPSLCGVFAC